MNVLQSTGRVIVHKLSQCPQVSNEQPGRYNIENAPYLACQATRQKRLYRIEVAPMAMIQPLSVSLCFHCV